MNTIHALMILLTLSACGRVPAEHIFKFDDSVTADERATVESTIAEINSHFGCEALKIDDSSENIIRFQSTAGLLIWGEYSYTGHGDVMLANDMPYATGLHWLIIHEFGHALGKMDHSLDGLDIMYKDTLAMDVSDETWSRYVAQVSAEGDPCGTKE